MITEKTKKEITAELLKDRKNFTGSDGKYAVSLGINNAQYSRIKNGETEKVLSDEKWITIARKINFNLKNNKNWNTAKTPIFEFIKTQMEICQKNGLSTLLCDMPEIGKTYTAMWYKKTHKNVVYVDCSQVKQKQKLIRYIAKEFGVSCLGKYSEIYEDLVFYIKTLEEPLIILDEAGDLNYDAFLEIKALWNATEMACGYYMMGADGLEEKINRSISNKKVGYAEIFSRFGRKYVKAVPQGKEDKEKIMKITAMMVIKANGNADTDINKILRSTTGEDNLPSLRRIYKALAIDKL